MNVNAIQQMLESQRRGGHLSPDFFQQLSQFRKIILRGAGYFGSEVGRQLLAHGITVDTLLYWDMRAAELGSIHGIPVALPFSELLNQNDVLVIHCIPNGSLSGSTILNELRQRGFTQIIDGMALFEAGFCRQNPEAKYDPGICLSTTVCNWDACERLLHFVQRDCVTPPAKAPPPLVFQVIAFLLNAKCSLSCTHCGQYINSYALQGKDEHVPFEQIKQDIDRFFAAVDSVAFVSVIGGEAFLHPDFERIMTHLLSKPNYGVVGVTTNGICKITESQLQLLKNNRTRVIFSDYRKALNDKQRALFAKNVAKVAEAGVSYSVGEPVWITPPTLALQDYSESQMVSMKSQCNSFRTCQTVKNGKLFPCGVTPMVYELGVGDYPTEYLELDAPNLRQQIQALHAQTYYPSCQHCGGGGEHLVCAGEQGYDKRYDHLLNGIVIVTA